MANAGGGFGLKYAVYVRVSTDKDEQVASIQNQIDICRYWIEKTDSSGMKTLFIKTKLYLEPNGLRDKLFN